MEIDLEKFKEIEAYLTEVRGDVDPWADGVKVYGRLDGALGPLRAIIRDEIERIAHEEQKAQDEAELVRFIMDTGGWTEGFAKESLTHRRDIWVERKQKVEKVIRNKVLAQQGYTVTSHHEMDANCDYVSHDGTRYSGMEWWAWSGIQEEKFPMKMLRNYSTHPVQYVDGVDING